MTATDAHDALYGRVNADLDEMIDNWRASLAQAPNVDPAQQWGALCDVIFPSPDAFELGHLFAMALDRLARQPKGARA
ncbi:MAG: hypothetical protein CK431_04510 [Mycobacterium sp.]|nr:MAG: hypothetical protein CK431_04510 [Mycobacterium sp.]